MLGIPQVINTKQDWLNTFNYVAANSNLNVDMKKEFVASLRALKSSGSTLILKTSVAKKDPDEQTPDDFELVVDQKSSLARSGLTIADIDAMIAQLS